MFFTTENTEFTEERRVVLLGFLSAFSSEHSERVVNKFFTFTLKNLPTYKGDEYGEWSSGEENICS